MKNILRLMLYAILTVAAIIVLGSLLHHHPTAGQAVLYQSLGPLFWRAVGIACVIYAIHAGVLLALRRFSTRSARWTALALYFGLPLFGMLLLTALGLASHGLEDSLKGLLAFLLASLLFFLFFPGLIIYSMPSSLPATLPLLAHYLFLTTFFAFLDNDSHSIVNSFAPPPPVIFYAIYLTLAGYLFPSHRRLKDFWAPSRLSRHLVARKGFTLIELLIVVAMLAILSYGIASLTGNTHRLVERQANWRAAVALAEEQFDLLRARSRLPALGRHPVDPEISGHFQYLAKQAELEVIAGPGERFREVWVHVRMRGDANDKAVSLAAILPTGEVKP